MELVTAPVFHKYVKGAVPPEALIVMEPLLPWLHVALLTLLVKEGPLEALIFTTAEFEQFNASKTCKKYCPADKLSD